VTKKLIRGGLRLGGKVGRTRNKEERERKKVKARKENGKDDEKITMHHQPTAKGGEPEKTQTPTPRGGRVRRG